MERLVYDYQGIRHIRDVLSASDDEQSLFQADVLEKYRLISEGGYTRPEIHGISLTPAALEHKARVARQAKGKK